VKPQLEPGTPNSEVVGVRIRDGASSSYAVLWDAFKRENIRVPYPVREIRIRGGPLPVETTVEVPS